MLKGINLHFLQSKEGTQTVDVSFSEGNVFAEDIIIAVGALVTKLSAQTGVDKANILKEVKRLLINNKSIKRGDNV